ncbi:MAG: hypothetical protein ALECFALPRED_007145 [Alectoria fallacina]|uniref:Uncharacterized protein n=1 Tax=Alectoria fallacina TaxID=1903189 RepID=A0A8H3G5P3_9LECA|nr:MAG: hypothetical protein ALECFALPRED_007145 [Alectoria fallacina]
MELQLARMHAENSISIRPTEFKHLTSMARIHLATFRDDDCVKSMYSDDIHWITINEMLEERLEQGPYAISVAMNKKLGPVVSWLCCGVVGHPRVTKWDGPAQLAWTVAAAFEAAETQNQLTRSSGESEYGAFQAERMVLREVIVSITTVVQSLAMGDNVYLDINNLAIDPKNDLGGVMPKLICSFTDSADKNGFSVLVQVPPFAVADYEWAGIQQIAGFVPRLDIHQLKFMVRRPEAR